MNEKILLTFSVVDFSTSYGLKIKSWTFFNNPFRLDFENVHSLLFGEMRYWQHNKERSFRTHHFAKLSLAPPSALLNKPITPSLPGRVDSPAKANLVSIVKKGSPPQHKLLTQKLAGS